MANATAKYLTGLCAAFIVPLQERDDECGTKRLNNTEDKEQNDHHQGYASQPHNESWYHAVSPYSL
jgi:ribonuclease HII